MVRDQEMVQQLQRHLKNWEHDGVCESPYHDPSQCCEYDKRGRLIRLHLCRLQLTQIPYHVWTFINLQELYLYNNQISILPAEVGSLSLLKGLHLRNNQISILPAEVGNLSSLQILELYNNQLSTLPAEVGDLSYLQELSLSSNQISILPAEVGNLSSLRSLSLEHNLFSILPAEVCNLSSLQELYMGYNQLGTLPAEVGNLFSLERLYLRSNQISMLPVEVCNLRSLQTLNMENNKLSMVPMEVCNLRSLQRLNLSRNQLSALPAEIGNLTSLRELRLSINQLSTLPAEMGNLTSLQTLYLDHNPLQTPPPEIIAKGTFAVLAYLRALPQAVERFEAKQPFVQEGKTMVQLSHDQELVKRLKQRFAEYSSHNWQELYDEQGRLMGLSLDHLKIAQLPSELWQFTSLQELDLRENQLSSLPAELGQLTNLQELVLYFNKLSSLPAELGQLANLHTLDLSDLGGNPQLRIPPPEVVQQGTPAVLVYLRALPQAKETIPLKIFYCYAHEDKDLRDRLDSHLSGLKRLGYVVGWYDREIQAGMEWEQEIEAHLSTASIILLLVSADFMKSDYCYGVEMQCVVVAPIQARDGSSTRLDGKSRHQQKRDPNENL